MTRRKSIIFRAYRSDQRKEMTKGEYTTYNGLLKSIINAEKRGAEFAILRFVGE